MVDGLCVGVLCALSRKTRDAKNSVGSCRQSHGYLNICRMSFRVTYNVTGWRSAGNSDSSRPAAEVDYYLQFKI